jgi:hypothetical protein
MNVESIGNINYWHRLLVSVLRRIYKQNNFVGTNFIRRPKKSLRNSHCLRYASADLFGSARKVLPNADDVIRVEREK